MNVSSSPTIHKVLQQSKQKLGGVGIGTAELDVLVLLEDLLHTNKAQLLAHPERELSREQQKVLNSQIERRAKYEPLAYIRGKVEFYGYEFTVNKHVLVPRPESETIIEILKHLVDSKQSTVDRKLKVVDVGTGSGALAITAKLEVPDAEVIATDIDKKCLKVAQNNTRTHRADITFLHGDLLSPFINQNLFQNECGRTKVETVLLCNLPYVPDNVAINEAALFEPKRAIFGGNDGLDLYRKLFAQIDKQNIKPKYVLTESLPAQHEKLAKLAQDSGYQLQQTHDFIQLFIHA